MNKYSYHQLAQRLMTIDEAKRLSTLDEQSYERRNERPHAIWSWQSVEAVLAQNLPDAQIDAMRIRKS